MSRGLRSSPIPLYVQIEEDIRSQIRTGKLAALDRVPSELELAESFGVSRMTARKSLDRLVDEGLLFRRPGKGTFVSQGKIAHGASTQLSFSAAMGALGLQVTTRVLDAGLVPAPMAIAHTLRQAERTDVVLIRRVRSVDGLPVAIHLAFLPQRLAPILEGDLTKSLNDLMTAAGARVSRAQDALEAVGAKSDEARLLGLRKGDPLIRVEGLGLSANGDPLRYTEALYRGDRFRFELESNDRTPDVRVEIKVNGDSRRT